MGRYCSKCHANVAIKGNRIFDNDEGGIYLLSSSRVSILENDIRRNTFWGIHIASTQAIVRENKIHENQCGGIYVDASGGFSKNTTSFLIMPGQEFTMKGH